MIRYLVIVISELPVIVIDPAPWLPPALGSSGADLLQVEGGGGGVAGGGQALCAHYDSALS